MTAAVQSLASFADAIAAVILVAFVIALIWALVEVVASERGFLAKLAWIAVILWLPLFGVVVYYATAEREL
jgi:hypothetical protein